jgi:hypothetical protein
MGKILENSLYSAILLSGIVPLVCIYKMNLHIYGSKEVVHKKVNIIEFLNIYHYYKTDPYTRKVQLNWGKDNVVIIVCVRLPLVNWYNGTSYNIVDHSGKVICHGKCEKCPTIISPFTLNLQLCKLIINMKMLSEITQILSIGNNICKIDLKSGQCIISNNSAEVPPRFKQILRSKEFKNCDIFDFRHPRKIIFYKKGSILN